MVSHTSFGDPFLALVCRYPLRLADVDPGRLDIGAIQENAFSRILRILLITKKLLGRI